MVDLPNAIEFKGTTLPVVSLILRSSKLDDIEAAIAQHLARAPFIFQDEAIVLDAQGLQETLDWHAAKAVLNRHHIYAHFISGLRPDSAEDAKKAGFVVLDHAGHRTQDTRATAPPTLTVEATHSASKPALIIDTPLRSGQQIYAKDRDLIILSLVNNGAEAVADGSIHIYAPLRGRALAGASGNTEARIFTTCFEAELVSVAGIYKTFEDGIPASLKKRAIHTQLIIQDNSQRLALKELHTTSAPEQQDYSTVRTNEHA